MQAGTKQGFSLVEMSVVVAIIGLLVGGIITGRTLAENARINKTIAETEFYKSAYVQFEARYNGLPGDFTGASRFFPGEQNGNGDGVIDWDDEGLRAWRHLEKANMIQAGDFSGTYDPSTGVMPVRDVPPVAYNARGGYSFAFEEALTSNHNFGVRGNSLHIGQQQVANTTRAPLFSGTVARSLDVKLDDGNPSTGFLRAWDATVNPRCTQGTLPDVSYNLASEGEACSLLLQF